MARRRRRGSRGRLLVAAIVIGVIAAGAWWWSTHRPGASGPATPAQPEAASAPVEVSAGRVDPRHEGRRIRASGSLHAGAPVRDPQFGLAVDALALERGVEMLQWNEHCVAAACSYRLDWVDRPVDSRAFHEPRGHDNPAAFPFRSQRFVTAAPMLGAFTVDVRAIDRVTLRSDHPVRVADLPPNLAASLRDCDGRLCTGDPRKPVAGDLRIRWRVVPPARITLAGIQRGSRLLP